MTFLGRRFRNWCITLAVSAAALILFRVLDLSLLVQQYYSGWALVFVIMGLLFFGLKKKLSVLPLGSNASWAQWHYYNGVFLVVLFLIHIEFSVPNGRFELALTAVLLSVVSMGFIGLIMNRVYARRLAQLNEEIIYERIATLRNELKQRLESQLFKSVERSYSSTLTSYYLSDLAGYFSTRHDFLMHLLGSTYQHKKRRSNLELQLRYLNKDEADFAVSLLDFIDQKYTLDCHETLQGMMKYWGLFHGPFSLVMSLMIMFHVVLVYAFRGAM